MRIAKCSVRKADFLKKTVDRCFDIDSCIIVFGSGKGSGATLFFFVIEFVGIGICLFFRNRKQIWALEN